MSTSEKEIPYLSSLVEKAKAGETMSLYELKQIKREVEQANRADPRLGVLRLMERSLMTPLTELERATQHVPEQPLIRNRVIDIRSDIQKDTHSLTDQISGKTSPALTIAKEALRNLQLEAGKIITELFKKQGDEVGMMGPTRALIKQAEKTSQNLSSGLEAERVVKKTQRLQTVEEDHGLVFSDEAPSVAPPAPKKKPETGRVKRSDLDDMFSRAEKVS